MTQISGVAPVSVGTVDFQSGNGTGRCFVLFQSHEQCNLVFAALPGPITTDASKLESKKLSVMNPGNSGKQTYIRIRKMA